MGVMCSWISVAGVLDFRLDEFCEGFLYALPILRFWQKYKSSWNSVISYHIFSQNLTPDGLSQTDYCIIATSVKNFL
jgi:hypothetical protein